MSFLARWAWLLLTTHHGLVVAMPVAATALRTCRRETRTSAIVLFSFGRLVVLATIGSLALHAAERQALHDPPLEDEIENDRRQDAQHRRAHHRPPKDHAPRDEQRESGRDGPHLVAAHEHLRIQELVPRLGEREERHHCQGRE